MKINESQQTNRHEIHLSVDEQPDRIALCRCWKSKKFPYCDGSHRQHNQLHEDNVGPVVILRNHPND